MTYRVETETYVSNDSPEEFAARLETHLNQLEGDGYEVFSVLPVPVRGNAITSAVLICAKAIEPAE